MAHGNQSGADMKIHAEFNSLAEMVSFGKFVGNDITAIPQQLSKKDKNLPVGVSSWEQAYATTEANLQRAYQRIREFEYIKKNNPVISAEYKNIEQKEKAKQDSIDVLNLSKRPYNCLKGYDILTVSDLLNCSWSDLQKMVNMGNKSIKEMRLALAARGLKLKGEK